MSNKPKKFKVKTKEADQLAEVESVQPKTEDETSKLKAEAEAKRNAEEDATKEIEDKYKYFKTEENINKIIKCQRLFRINRYIKYFKTEENINKIIKCQRLFRINRYIKKVKPKIERILKLKRKEFVYEETIFGVENKEIIKNLKIAHNIRQTQMKEGDIAQVVLGNFYGWKDLGTGHETGLDLLKEDNSAIIELKNKWNTCNSSSSKALCDKLSNYKKKNTNTRCIWGVINPKDINKNNSSKFEYDGVIIEKLEGNELLDYIFTYKNYNYKKDILYYIKEIINSL
jgi:hypothetical protein